MDKIEYRYRAFCEELKEYATHKGIEQFRVDRFMSEEMGDICFVAIQTGKRFGIVCFGNDTKSYALYDRKQNLIFNLRNNWYDILEDFMHCYATDTEENVTSAKQSEKEEQINPDDVLRTLISLMSNYKSEENSTAKVSVKPKKVKVTKRKLA